MKTLLYADWDRLEVATRPDPAPGVDEVLLRVAACGICGSELEGFKNRSPRRTPPLVMGHEFCGTIAAMGTEVSGFEVGQRVVSNSLVSCGECVRCRRGDTHLCAERQIFGMKRLGAFAEYVPVPARCLLAWPDALPAQAACLAEPLANGVHMVHLTRDINPQTVLVIGVGPIGLMAVQAFRAMTTAEVFVSDLSAERLEAARRVGAAQSFDPKQVDVVQAVRELTEGEGVDVVIDAAGAALTKQQSLAAVRPGGSVVWIGLHDNTMSLDSYEITLPEKRVLGTYAAHMRDLQEALDLMAGGQVDATSWVHTFPLDEGVEAFMRMLAAQGNDIKAVLLPEGT